MSFEETSDLADLCEYDEYDTYNVKTYQPTYASNFNEYGVPLSVELSESLGESQTLANAQPANCFVKASEIFLRLDLNNVTTGTNSISNASTRDDNVDILRISGKTEETSDVIIHEDCVDLQYGSDIDCPNGAVIGEMTQARHKRDNSLDNEYEELLIEGIN